MVDVTWANVKKHQSGVVAAYPDATKATITLGSTQLNLAVKLDDGDGNVKSMNVSVDISDVAGLSDTLIAEVKAVIDGA